MAKYINTSIFIIFILVLCEFQTECTQLFISEPFITENKEFNITCNSSEFSPFSSWQIGNETFFVSKNTTGHCITQNADAHVVNCYVYDGKSYIVTVSVRSDQHGENLVCVINGKQSKTFRLNITVPVTNVTLYQDSQSTIILKENVNSEVRCVTSFSRPRANIVWYIYHKSESTPTYINETNMACSYVQNNRDLLSTNCTINVKLNRTFNGWHLVCIAENKKKYIPVISGNVTLNITYPTNKPIVSCTNNGIYKVVHNTKGNLTCTVDGGNPAGKLHWHCTGHVTQGRGPHNSETPTIVWFASQSQNCTCTSTNMAGDSSTLVKTELLYPPETHKMRNETIIEGDSVTLYCNVTRANPPVYMIRWSSKNHSVLAATLTISNVSRSDDMEYTCTANNSMDPSCRDVVQGSTSTSLHLEVLYPPFVNIIQGKTYTVKEGDTFDYTCPFVPGNPSTTNLTWRRSNDTKTWSSAKLYINKVTRHDDSVYKCYATNVMVNSNGTSKTGNVSSDIRLIVQFEANVTEFYIEGYVHNISAVVMENTSLHFVCRLQSNPTADVGIYKMETAVQRSKTNALSYYTNASCSGANVKYSCHGNNSMNNISSIRQLELIVKCKPRADSNMFIEYTAINNDVTLSYTALAYPHPSFIWYRNGSYIKVGDPHNIVSSYNLQTHLTINNMEERDFGEYYLNVSNEFGSITELFQIKPQGVPEVPTHLTQNSTNTTDSTIALNWRHGIKNGLVQTFTVLYSKHGEAIWQNATVPDTGSKGTKIHYSITGLSSYTNYDIVVFAVNTMGRSKSNATLTCRTKRIEPIDDTTGHSPIIGAVAGSAGGLLVLGVVIAGVVILRRRFFKQPNCPTIQPQIPVTYENLKINQIPNESVDYHMGTADHRTLETNLDCTYEGLTQEDSGKENEYTCLSNQSGDDPETTYENLKIQL